MTEVPHANILARAQGCLLGQLAGDSLGSLVEFQPPERIRKKYPGGVRDLADGGTWNTLAGQPTDDSEMALMLARMLAERGTYDAEASHNAYRFWLKSDPFDCGMTVSGGLSGHPNPESQANGALMRISPLGIFGWNRDPEQLAAWARADAAITHPHPVCLEANELFVFTLAFAIRKGREPTAIYEFVKGHAIQRKMDAGLLLAVLRAVDQPPADFVSQQGWVLIAMQNAMWQLLHAPTLEAGVIDTVMRGGDTDTNAAIAGALLGAVHGRGAVPERWAEAILNCRPEEGRPGVRQPRPECFWPVDALELAEKLIPG